MTSLTSPSLLFISSLGCPRKFLKSYAKFCHFSETILSVHQISLTNWQKSKIKGSSSFKLQKWVGELHTALNNHLNCVIEIRSEQHGNHEKNLKICKRRQHHFNKKKKKKEKWKKKNKKKFILFDIELDVSATCLVSFSIKRFRHHSHSLRFSLLCIIQLLIVASSRRGKLIYARLYNIFHLYGSHSIAYLKSTFHCFRAN